MISLEATTSLQWMREIKWKMNIIILFLSLSLRLKSFIQSQVCPLCCYCCCCFCYKNDNLLHSKTISQRNKCNKRWLQSGCRKNLVRIWGWSTEPQKWLAQDWKQMKENINRTRKRKTTLCWASSQIWNEMHNSCDFDDGSSTSAAVSMCVYLSIVT